LLYFHIVFTIISLKITQNPAFKSGYKEFLGLLKEFSMVIFAVILADTKDIDIDKESTEKLG
jgi:hypothetical protein